jgi:hypothetical protein
MNLKRGMFAALGAFGVIFVADLGIHQVWLGDFYQAHAAWWRPAAEMQRLMPLMFVSQALLSLLLTAVYAKGYQPDRGGLMQGVRFGLLMGLLLMGPCSLMSYVIYPYPTSLIFSWLAGGLVEIALAGAAIGALYKSDS